MPKSKTTPAPWVFGYWTIYTEDRPRPSQKRGDSYWTLMPFDGLTRRGGVFCRGPFGRKSMEPESVIHAEGCETDGVSFDEDFLKLLLEKMNA